MKRVFLIVLDSFGIGQMPDAAAYGDINVNTLGSVSKSPYFHMENMKNMGLFNIDGVEVGEKTDHPTAAYTRMTERSRGKDTTIGHWEIAGIYSPKPLPTYPDGFPEDVLEEFRIRTGRDVLCNKPYSGTQVIADYGDEHVRTGKLIVYTSADSVFQIAMNVDKFGLDTLYHYCEVARKMLVGDWACGRVIARPYIINAEGKRERTSDRKDYSVTPPGDTILDMIKNAGKMVYAIGKIHDIFNGKGVVKSVHTTSNMDGIDKTIEAMREDFEGLIFTNLVDFDAKYGHRRDPEGYARCIEEFDARLPEIMKEMVNDDVLMICADHGNDPTAPGTDHTREYIPIITWGHTLKYGAEIGIRDSFGDIGATICELLRVPFTGVGTSFKKQIVGW